MVCSYYRWWLINLRGNFTTVGNKYIAPFFTLVLGITSSDSPHEIFPRKPLQPENATRWFCWAFCGAIPVLWQKSVVFESVVKNLLVNSKPTGIWPLVMLPCWKSSGLDMKEKLAQYQRSSVWNCLYRAHRKLPCRWGSSVIGSCFERSMYFKIPIR